MQMKNKKLKLSALLLLFLGLTRLKAQQATTASGGNASGTGGSLSFSVGEVVYTTNASASGSMAQGVQQSYEISVVTGLDLLDVQLDLSVYPNPICEFLTLQVDKNGIENLMYQLSDINGKILESKKIAAITNIISMEHYANAIYFLKVTQNQRDIKTFKIIKNN